MKFIFSSAVMVLAQRESGQVLFLLLDEKPPSDNIRLKDGEVYTIFLSWAVLMARKSPSDKEVCDFIKKDHPAIM